jgi:type I restriction enzyme S subunit
LDEQRDIALALDCLDQKVGIHERTRNVLSELFDTLLHQLMAGEIRVADLDIDTSEVVIQ